MRIAYITFVLALVLLGCKGREPEQQIIFAAKAFYDNAKTTGSGIVYIAGTLMKRESSANVRSVVRAVAYPPGTKKNPMSYGMPPFAQLLSDVEVAAVVTYIRTAWGNRGAPVTPRETNALRAATFDWVNR